MATARRARTPSTPPSPREPSAAAAESRGARRKRETREKLLGAAFALMAERGVDGVAINEITEAADVGFGSFYNHFPSKEAIYEEVFSQVFERFGDALDTLTAPMADPAEVIAVCVRHAIVRAREEPLWGSFLLREGFREQALTRGLARRLFRDVAKGTAEERFSVPDPMMSVLAAGGAVLGAIALQSATSAGKALFAQRGALTKNLDQRAAAAILRSLGLSDVEATALSGRPLPPLPAEPVWHVHHD
jgi:AcrR family transcriptional regulator